LAPGLHIETGPTINLYQQSTSVASPTAENHWRGNNLGAWASPESDRFYDAYAKALEPTERVQAIAGMERTFTQTVGSIPLYFDVVVTAHTGNLEGPVGRETPDSAPDYRNIQLWRWTE